MTDDETAIPASNAADRADFIARWWRLQLLAAFACAAVLGTAIFYPKALIFVWAVALPLLTFRMWRLRCWKCHRRIISNGGAEIEWRKDRRWGWAPGRHKPCGAPLI